MSALLHGVPLTDAAPTKPGRKPRPLDIPQDDMVPGEEIGAEAETTMEAQESPSLKTKKRGRPAKVKQDLDGIKQMLLMTHVMLAGVTKCPELTIAEEEATAFANSLAALSEHYKIKLTGKTGAIIGFLYTLGVIYGPRAVAIGIRVRNERRDHVGHTPT